MKPTTNNTNTNTNTASLLPGRVDSAMLAKYLQAGEPVVVLKLVGVGNSAPYDFRDKGTRSYIFRFDANAEGHLLRIPLHLWQENRARLAHDIMDQRHLAHAMIVTLETPPAAATTAAAAASSSIPQTTIPAEMGATDTSTDTRNVVGPGAEPTVAPTSAHQATEGTPSPAKDTEVTPPSAKDADDNAEGSTASVDSATVQAEEPPLLGGRPLHEAAYDLVEPPKRLKALAALLGVAEPTLRAALAHPGSRIELATAGWVRRKA